MGERNFLRSERESGQQFKSDLQEKALESNERNNMLEKKLQA